MAFTVSNIVKTVIGDQRLRTYIVTADNTSGTVSTGIPVVLDALLAPVNIASASTMNIPVIALNALNGGTGALGTIALSNCVSGDIYHLWVIGRS